MVVDYINRCHYWGLGTMKTPVGELMINSPLVRYVVYKIGDPTIIFIGLEPDSVWKDAQEADPNTDFSNSFDNPFHEDYEVVKPGIRMAKDVYASGWRVKHPDDLMEEAEHESYRYENL